MTGPSRWSRVDRVMLMDKHCLSEDDACFYYLQKDGLGFAEGPNKAANQTIINFKHDPHEYSRDSWPMHYKREALRMLSGAVCEFFEDRERILGGGVTLVPVPTSKPRAAADHDPRLDVLCEIVSKRVPFVTYVPLLDTIRDVGKVHRREASRSVREIRSNLALDRSLIRECSDTVALLDDVLTTGAHFSACKGVVSEVLPGASVFGLFLAVQLRTPLRGAEDEDTF